MGEEELREGSPGMEGPLLAPHKQRLQHKWTFPASGAFWMVTPAPSKDTGTGGRGNHRTFCSSF